MCGGVEILTPKGLRAKALMSESMYSVGFAFNALLTDLDRLESEGSWEWGVRLKNTHTAYITCHDFEVATEVRKGLLLRFPDAAVVSRYVPPKYPWKVVHPEEVS